MLVPVSKPVSRLVQSVASNSVVVPGMATAARVRSVLVSMELPDRRWPGRCLSQWVLTSPMVRMKLLRSQAFCTGSCQMAGAVPLVV